MRRIAYITFISLLGLAQVWAQSEPLSKEEIEKEVRILLKSDCEATNYKECMDTIIKKYKSLGAVAAPILIRLYDSERDLRWRILMHLGYAGGEDAFAFLTAQVRNQKDAELLTYAATGLAWVHDKRAFDDLAHLLDHAHPSVRRAATAALGELKDARAIPLLEKASRSDPNEKVRSFAFKNLTLIRLAKLSAEEKFTLLTQGLLAAEEASDTEKLKWFLLRIGEGKYPDSLKVISKYVTHKDLDIRHNAIIALGALGDTGAIPLLEQMTRTDPSGQVREHAEKTISYLKTSREKNK